MARVAAVILAARGALAGLAAVVLLFNAAALWPPATGPSRCANCPTDLDAHTLMAHQFLVLGLFAVVVAVPSLLFALMSLNGRTSAVMSVVLGEASLAAALIFVAGWALTNGATSVAALIAVVPVVTSIPVEALLITHLRRA